jgi:hypothetical protein
MKKTLNFLFAILAVAATCSAQQYSPITILNGTTDRIVANTTSNYSTGAFTFDVRKQRNLGLLLSWKLTGTGTDNTVFTFERSLDNSTYDATSTFVVTVANTGATTVTIGTNMALNGYGWVRLKSILNNDTGDAITNLLVQGAIKQAD